MSALAALARQAPRSPQPVIAHAPAVGLLSRAVRLAGVGLIAFLLLAPGFYQLQGGSELLLWLGLVAQLGTLVVIWKIGRAGLPRYGTLIPLAGCLTAAAAPLFAARAPEHAAALLQTLAVACVYFLALAAAVRAPGRRGVALLALPPMALVVGSFGPLAALWDGYRTPHFSNLAAGLDVMSQALSLPGIAAVAAFLAVIGGARLAERFLRERNLAPIDSLALAALVHLAAVWLLLAVSLHAETSAVLTALPAVAILFMWMLAQGRPRLEILLFVLLLTAQWLQVSGLGFN